MSPPQTKKWAFSRRAESSTEATLLRKFPMPLVVSESPAKTNLTLLPGGAVRNFPTWDFLPPGPTNR